MEARKKQNDERKAKGYFEKQEQLKLDNIERFKAIRERTNKRKENNEKHCQERKEIKITFPTTANRLIQNHSHYSSDKI